MLVLMERTKGLGSYLGAEKKRKGKSSCGAEYEKQKTCFLYSRDIKIYRNKIFI